MLSKQALIAAVKKHITEASLLIPPPLEYIHGLWWLHDGIVEAQGDKELEPFADLWQRMMAGEVEGEVKDK